MTITLQPHQAFTVEHFVGSPNRGMLVIHGAGTGKTLTAVSIAEHLRQYKEVLVVAPKSLHDNMRATIQRFSKHADMSRYRFISSNAGNMITKLETSTDDLTGMDVKSLRLDDKLIIVDEAHNVLVAASNGSKNASAFYDMLMAARNCRILLMTASPIINTVYEAAIALNVCKGYLRTEDGERTTLLPENAEDFARFFIDQKTMTIKNADKLRNRIGGLVSYKGDIFERPVPDFYQMLKTTVKKELYPDYSIRVEMVRMSGPQYGAYEQAREKERLETRRSITGKGQRIVLHPEDLDDHVSEQERRDAHYIAGGELKRDSAFKVSTSYRIRSRQLSNVFAPEDKDPLEDVAMYAPKIQAIAAALKPGEKTIIYSNFIKSGIAVMAAHLETMGYQRYDPARAPEPDAKYYGLYIGDVSPEDRTTTLAEYNKPDSPLTVLLISSSGSEGLSTVGTRAVHIMEPYWNYERIMQVMFRAIRYRSHEHLPENQRKVLVHLYIAMPPKGTKTAERTTDMYLFQEMARKYQINQQMVKLMASVAIDCDRFNQGANIQCHHCETKRGMPLFMADINADMQYPSPCAAKPIKAKEVRISGHLYYIDKSKRIFIKTGEDAFEEVLDPDIQKWVLERMPAEK